MSPMWSGWAPAPTTEEYEKMGVKGFNATTNAINEDGVLELNETVTREAGSPSAGCITTAGDIALFYQALLNDGRAHEGTPVWQPDMLKEARRVRTGELRDPFSATGPIGPWGLLLPAEMGRPICAASGAPIPRSRSGIRALAARAVGPTRQRVSRSVS